MQQSLQRTQRLWLVRHGITQWNSEQRFCGHSDMPLSPEGRKQAQWLAWRLRREQITTIYSSDLLRAQQTAEIIAAQRSLPVQREVSADWREMGFGEWEGLTYTQITQQFAAHLDFFTDPVHHAPPGGESVISLLQRVQQAFIALVHAATEEQEKAGAIVLVSHGGPLRILLCTLLAMPLERQWQLRLDHGSLSAIDFLLPADTTGSMATLALLNERANSHTEEVQQQEGQVHHG